MANTTQTPAAAPVYNLDWPVWLLQAHADDMAEQAEWDEREAARKAAR